MCSAETAKQRKFVMSKLQAPMCPWKAVLNFFSAVRGLKLCYCCTYIVHPETNLFCIVIAVDDFCCVLWIRYNGYSDEYVEYGFELYPFKFVAVTPTAI